MTEVKLPIEFRGCTWDDGWEFDAPTVVYFPFFMYGIGGNSEEFDHLVEDWCIDVACGITRRRGLSKFDNKEFKWRGWDKYGMKYRKNAWHSRVRVKWYLDDRGLQAFDYEGPVETHYGPFAKGHNG